MSNLGKSVVLIPAYRPEPILPELVKRLMDAGFAAVYVVDDGSGPEVQNLFTQVEKIPGARLLRHARNLGKGAALKTGINAILVDHPKTAGIVTADADGQHRVEDIVRVGEALEKNPDTFVLGSRRFRGEVPLRSRFGNECTKLVFRLLVGKALMDTQTGLRGIPRALALDLLPIRTNRYEFELDMLVKAVSERRKFLEIEIATIYEDGNRSSHFNPLLDSLRIYFVFFRFLLASLMVFFADLIVFSLAYWSIHSLFASVVLGRASGLVVSILGSRRFVFRSQQKLSQILPKFLVLWLGLLGISYGLTLLLTAYFNWNTYAARIFVDGTLFLFNFAVQRNFIFGTPAQATGEE